MQTKTELTGLKQKIIIHRMLGTSLASFAVFLLGFIFLPVLIAEANATQRVDANVRWSAIDLTFDPDVDATTNAADPEAELASATHGDIAFGTIVPTAKLGANYGTMVIKKKTLGVTTRGKYYAVYLSMNDAETALTYGGATDTSMKISSTSGTWDNPVTFVANNNSGWGYMVPGTTVKQSDGTTASYFSSLTQSDTATAIDDFINQNIHSADGTAYTDTRWAAVPAAKTATTTTSKPQQIWKGLTNNGAGFSTQDTFNIYYAINVDTDIMAGTYENQIVYTAIASSESLDSVSNNLARTTKFGTAGTVQTIYFDLAQTNANIVNYDNITIKLVPHTTMAAANYNPSALSAEAKAAAIECPKVANSFSTVTVQQATTEGSTSSIQCTMPAASEATEYDYWLSVDGYNFNYASKIDNGNEAGFAYVGLQTKRANGTPYVTTMQDMSAGVCANTNKWTNGLGSQAVLKDPTGTNAITVATTETRAEAIAANKLPSDFATSTTADGIGTFALRDSRDGKRYLIRRLADGNCWMVQNLNLDLYTGMTLTSADSDINPTRGSWTLASTAENTNDEVNENIVLELTSGADKGLAWKADGGSTSKAWQTAHGIETVTLTEYTYTPQTPVTPGEGEDPEETTDWTETTIAYCNNGTAQQPCFATTSTSVAYYKVVDADDIGVLYSGTAGQSNARYITADMVGTELAVSAAMALNDTYKTDATTGSPIRGFEAGEYWAKVSYQVRKVNAPNLGATGSAYSTITLGPDGTSTNPGTCTYSYYKDHLKEGKACVITTTGDPMITQFSNDGSGIGMNTAEVPRLAITQDHLGNSIDFMNNTSSTSTAFTYSDATYTVFPMSTTGADYRWARNGRDGAHVMDTGPMYFNNSYAESTVQVDEQNTTYYTMTFGNGQSRCANLSTVQGILTDPATGNPYSFVSCMDGSDASAQALADSRVDGNWYNWYAAVAGSAYISGGASTRADDSICPKGWKLPSNNASNSGVQDFYGLIKGGYALGNNTDSNQATNTQNSNSVDAKLGVFPLSFSRIGSYDWASGGLNYRGSNGNYWSAASYSDTRSYGLNFYSTRLSPRGDNAKGSGFAVRCVASAE